MSWGYFADLRLTMPAKAWDELRKTKPDDVTLNKGWFGCEDPDLEAGFAMTLGRAAPADTKVTFEKLLARAYTGKESICTVEKDDAQTRVRACLLLDKSELYLARPLAALLEAARKVGGEGALQLVNDGTYSGEGGVAITLKKGKLSRRAIGEDCHDIGEELGMEIFAGVMPEAPKKSGKPKINPFTGKPIK
jgi:hypothetical protein